VQNNNVVVE